MTHTSVHGYVEQPESAIRAVNDNKHLEELVLRQIERIHAAIVNGYIPMREARSMRHLMDAERHIEMGFMLLNRAIMQPSRISGDLDVEEIARDIDTLDKYE